MFCYHNILQCHFFILNLVLQKIQEVTERKKCISGKYVLFIFLQTYKCSPSWYRLIKHNLGVLVFSTRVIPGAIKQLIDLKSSRILLPGIGK